MTRVLGIDIGGTNIRIGLIGEDLQPVSPIDVINSKILCEIGAVKGVITVIREYLAKYEISMPELISIGVPGAVSGDFKTVFKTPNLIDTEGRCIMDNLNLADPISSELGARVYVNKDVNNLLFHDMKAFELSGTVVGCYIGTGLGTAVIQSGKLLYGRNGFAMDVGHMPLYGTDEPCGCGKRGCAEGRVSGVRLRKIHKANFDDTPIDEIFVNHMDTEPVREFVSDCAIVPATLLTIFDPDALVMGGGVIELPGFPKELFEVEMLRQTEQAVAGNPPKIVYDDKLPERGVIGAACFAFEMEE